MPRQKHRQGCVGLGCSEGSARRPVPSCRSRCRSAGNESPARSRIGRRMHSVSIAVCRRLWAGACLQASRPQSHHTVLRVLTVSTTAGTARQALCSTRATRLCTASPAMPGAVQGTTIVLIANSSYAVGLAALLRSLVRHTQPLPKIYVVDAGLTRQDRVRADQARTAWRGARLHPAWSMTGWCCVWPPSRDQLSRRAAGGPCKIGKTTGLGKSQGRTLCEQPCSSVGRRSRLDPADLGHSTRPAEARPAPSQRQQL